jgi:CheY-like chemotaxis protein
MQSRTPRVLICDDCAPIRELLSHVLEYEGYAVVEAAHGAEALQQLRFVAVDIVIMDLRMPVMDGFEAIRHIRRRWPQTAIVAHSSLGTEEASPIVRSIGADVYVEKGCPDELVSAVNSAVRKRAAANLPAAQR